MSESILESGEVKLPKLTRANWNTSFKQAFQLLALQCGEAGEIILSRQDVVLVEPVRDQLVNRMDERGQAVVNAEGQPVQVRKYADDQRGDHKFDADKKRFKNLKEGKKKLIAKLLSAMDKDVSDAVRTSVGFENLFMQYDLLGLWNLTEQVVMGRGAVSVYALIVRFLKCKQDGSYIAFEKEFKEMVSDLNAQGQPLEILEKIYNAVFIMAVNQEQFKDKLNRIYGEHDWPNYVNLSAEFHTFAEATERMSEIRKDSEIMKVNANVVQPKSLEKRGVRDRREVGKCWNCGSTSHMRADCEEESTKCGKCGKRGHMSKFCFGDKGSKRAGDGDRKPSGRVLQTKNSTIKGKKSGKVSQVKKILGKIVASLADGDFDDEEEEHSEREVDDEEVDEDDDEEFYDDASANVITCCVGLDSRMKEGEVKEISSDMKTVRAYGVESEMTSQRYVIDSGCRGAHVVTSDHILDTKLDMSKWKKTPYVYGISGHRLETTDAGYLAPIDGLTLVTPQASSNLLSLMEMVKRNDGSFYGDKKQLTVIDSKGQVILRGVNKGDDFWTCGEQDLQRVVKGLVGDVGDQFMDLSDKQQHLLDISSARHLTAEERVRAKEAYNLCQLLRHPGDEIIVQSLENNLFHNTYLSAQDFRNGRTLLGPCLACQEGKMRAPSEPTSVSEPARAIGEHIHADLILLKNKGKGGITVILVATDEKSSYIVAVPCTGKSEAVIKEAAKAMIAEFNTYGHRVTRVTTDDEHSLQTLRKHLGSHGVVVTATPAGLHEKRIENRIRTIKDRKRSMLAGLPYELPIELETEAYLEAIMWINRVPNKATGPATTAYQLFTRKKAPLPQFYFGQFGLFYSVRKDVDQRSEWGIFIGYGAHQRYYRCYNPLTKSVTSKQKFVPQSTSPAAWGLKSRLRLGQFLNLAGEKVTGNGVKFHFSPEISPSFVTLKFGWKGEQVNRCPSPINRVLNTYKNSLLSFNLTVSNSN